AEPQPDGDAYEELHEEQTRDNLEQHVLLVEVGVRERYRSDNHGQTGGGADLDLVEQNRTSHVVSSRRVTRPSPGRANHRIRSSPSLSPSPHNPGGSASRPAMIRRAAASWRTRTRSEAVATRAEPPPANASRRSTGESRTPARCCHRPLTGSKRYNGHHLHPSP